VAITLVNEEEMYRFAAIEKLIEATVTKIQLPPHIGQSPEWNPARSKRSFPPRKGGSTSHGNQSQHRKNPISGNAAGSNNTEGQKKRNFKRKSKKNQGGSGT
jgi:hypothetical protein